MDAVIMISPIDSHIQKPRDWFCLTMQSLLKQGNFRLGCVGGAASEQWLEHGGSVCSNTRAPASKLTDVGN